MTTRGMSLLELTVAMAIFALVAVMAASALTSSINLERRLGATETATLELAYALALLRRDLGQGTALSIVAPDRSVASPVVLEGSTGPLTMTVADEPVLPGVPETGFARVTWAFDPSSETLTRRYTAIGPETPQDMPAVAVLNGVTEASIRVLSPDGWTVRLGVPEPGGGQAQEALQGLPVGVEFLLQTRRYGSLRVFEAF